MSSFHSNFHFFGWDFAILRHFFGGILSTDLLEYEPGEQEFFLVSRNSSNWLGEQGILERLDAGEVILGDGSYVNTLEKRGYVKVGVTEIFSFEHAHA